MALQICRENIRVTERIVALPICGENIRIIERVHDVRAFECRCKSNIYTSHLESFNYICEQRAYSYIWRENILSRMCSQVAKERSQRSTSYHESPVSHKESPVSCQKSPTS